MFCDQQVVDIPEGLTESHDLTVDYVLTPSRVIQTECKIPKPRGIIWSKVNPNIQTAVLLLLHSYMQKIAPPLDKFKEADVLFMSAYPDVQSCAHFQLQLGQHLHKTPYKACQKILEVQLILE